MGFEGLWESILDIIYPPNIGCAICTFKGANLLDHGVCRACEEQLFFIEPPVCLICGRLMLADNKVCSDCEKEDYAFYSAMSIFEFDTGVKNLIHRYKYRGERFLATPMIHWMTEGLKKQVWDLDILVPVPLHPTRERKRGFNQARLLAEGISENLDIPLINKRLLRIKDTPHQARLGRRERRKNLAGAFRVEGGWQGFQGKTILLVDDVYTTGSTAHQCSKELLKSGAKRVYVITLALGTGY